MAILGATGSMDCMPAICKNEMTQAQGEDEDKSSTKRYNGVCRRPWGKFAVEIRYLAWQGPNVWLGTFNRAEEVTMAYDKASLFIRGTHASLKFPIEVVTKDLATLITYAPLNLYRM
jgi:hypothetical protein